MWLRVLLVLAIGVAAQPGPAAAQTLTGSLVGIVKDTQGRVIEGAAVRVTSESLGLVQSQKSNRHGYLRFLALPPGEYVLDIEAPGFAPYREEGVRIGVGATLERTVVLDVAGVRESLVVQGSGSRIEARSSGFATRFGLDGIRTIPTRRFSMFDFIRVARADPASRGPTITGCGSGNRPRIRARDSVRPQAGREFHRLDRRWWNLS